jgi:hypothetical protein
VLDEQGRFRSDGSAPRINVYAAADRQKLLSLGEFPELAGRDIRWARTGMTLEKCLHLIPAANLIVTLAPSSDELILRRLDVTAAMDKAGIEYLFITSMPPRVAQRGHTYAYPIAVKSKRGGVQYTLDSAPDGMTLSAEGRLEWKVPETAPLRKAGVIVTVKDASGREVYHAFDVAVR